MTSRLEPPQQGRFPRLLRKISGQKLAEDAAAAAPSDPSSSKSVANKSSYTNFFSRRPSAPAQSTRRPSATALQTPEFPLSQWGFTRRPSAASMNSEDQDAFLSAESSLSPSRRPSAMELGGGLLASFSLSGEGSNLQKDKPLPSTAEATLHRRTELHLYADFDGARASNSSTPTPTKKTSSATSAEFQTSPQPVALPRIPREESAFPGEARPRMSIDGKRSPLSPGMRTQRRMQRFSEDIQRPMPRMSLSHDDVPVSRGRPSFDALREATRGTTLLKAPTIFGRKSSRENLRKAFVAHASTGPGNAADDDEEPHLSSHNAQDPLLTKKTSGISKLLGLRRRDKSSLLQANLSQSLGSTPESPMASPMISPAIEKVPSVGAASTELIVTADSTLTDKTDRRSRASSRSSSSTTVEIKSARLEVPDVPTSPQSDSAVPVVRRRSGESKKSSSRSPATAPQQTRARSSSLTSKSSEFGAIHPIAPVSVKSFSEDSPLTPPKKRSPKKRHKSQRKVGSTPSRRTSSLKSLPSPPPPPRTSSSSKEDYFEAAASDPTPSHLTPYSVVTMATDGISSAKASPSAEVKEDIFAHAAANASVARLSEFDAIALDSQDPRPSADGSSLDLASHPFASLYLTPKKPHLLRSYSANGTEDGAFLTPAMSTQSSRSRDARPSPSVLRDVSPVSFFSNYEDARQTPNALESPSLLLQVTTREGDYLGVSRLDPVGGSIGDSASSPVAPLLPPKNPRRMVSGPSVPQVPSALSFMDLALSSAGESGPDSPAAISNAPLPTLITPTKSKVSAGIREDVFTPVRPSIEEAVDYRASVLFEASTPMKRTAQSSQSSSPNSASAPTQAGPKADEAAVRSEDISTAVEGKTTKARLTPRSSRSGAFVPPNVTPRRKSSSSRLRKVTPPALVTTFSARTRGASFGAKDSFDRAAFGSVKLNRWPFSSREAGSDAEEDSKTNLRRPAAFDRKKSFSINRPEITIASKPHATDEHRSRSSSSAKLPSVNSSPSALQAPRSSSSALPSVATPPESPTTLWTRGELDADVKRILKRRNIIRELVQTERAYASDMAVIRDLYLARAQPQTGLRSPTNLSRRAASSPSATPVSPMSRPAERASEDEPPVDSPDAGVSIPSTRPDMAQRGYSSDSIAKQMTQADDLLSSRLSVSLARESEKSPAGASSMRSPALPGLGPFSAVLSPLSAADVRVLFAGVEHCATFADEFSDLLETSMGTMSAEELPSEAADLHDEADDCVGALFSSMSERIHQVFAAYCSKHEASMAMLQNLMATSPQAAAFFDECTIQARRFTNAWDLGSLLIKPVQRMLKYPLLLQEILSATTIEHPDYHNLAKAIEEMQRVADSINELSRRKEIIHSIVSNTKSTAMSKQSSSKAFSGLRKKQQKAKEAAMAASRSQGDAVPQLLLEDEYQIMAIKMRGLEEGMDAFGRHCLSWSGKVKATFEAERRLLNKWVDVYAFVETSAYDATTQVESIRSMIEVVSQLSGELHAQTDAQIRETIVPSLESIRKMFTGPQAYMCKRDEREEDYTRYRALAEKDKAVDRRVLESARGFVALHNQLCEEMPVFISGIKMALDLVVMRFAKIQSRHHKQLRDLLVAFVSQHQTEWADRTAAAILGQDHLRNDSGEELPTIVSARKIAQRWWASHQPLDEALENLTITRRGSSTAWPSSKEGRSRGPMTASGLPEITGRRSQSPGAVRLVRRTNSNASINGVRNDSGIMSHSNGSAPDLPSVLTPQLDSASSGTGPDCNSSFESTPQSSVNYNHAGDCSPVLNSKANLEGPRLLAPIAAMGHTGERQSSAGSLLCSISGTFRTLGGSISGPSSASGSPVIPSPSLSTDAAIFAEASVPKEA